MRQKNLLQFSAFSNNWNYIEYVSKQILTFLNFKASHLVPEIGDFLGSLIEKCKKNPPCISKSNRKGEFCPYCFSEKVLNKLKKLKADREIINEFVILFNLNSVSF